MFVGILLRDSARDFNVEIESSIPPLRDFRYQLARGPKTMGSHLKDVRAHCYCASLVHTQFIGHARATSFLSARTESKT